MDDCNFTKSDSQKALEYSLKQARAITESIHNSTECSRYIRSMVDAATLPYKKLLEDINLHIAESTKSVVDELTAHFRDSLYGSQAMRDLISSFHEMPELGRSITSSHSSLLLSEKKLTDDLRKTTSKMVTSQLLSSISSGQNATDDALDCSDNDYVTLPEENIKEYDFPSEIAIPLGNRRYKIRTDYFLNIITILITIMCTILPMLSSPDEKETVQNFFNVQIYNLEGSADYSNSSIPDFQVISEVPLPEDDSSE